ncbi:MAG: RdgB/HAM1 family non-canonical purine NTP pyrophosphatase [Gammaproteobacteria bacterium]|nr:RdgB/HAM1 family non-canonical purine NTP pyrophosphatase [Gammaproteobacteria bacterium]
MDRIVLASGNRGKLQELEQLLSELTMQLIPQTALGVGDVAETGLSFVENALIKARHACEETGLPSIADDSGLEVDALNGEPGIYSARFSGVFGKEADAANNARLLAEMEQVAEAERSARFHCVIVYLRYARDPMPLICQGSWEGSILFEESGSGGFGYDPLFYVPTHQCASAQLTPKIKNSLSHRGQALRQLLQCFNTRR